MNKTAIKNFAIWARKELIEKSSQRAKIYGIEKDKEMKVMDTALNGQVLTKNEKDARKVLIEKINQDGFDQTIEEVAYTWFNRFIALRFMEVNGYMPSHIRVFSSEDNEFQPQILSEAIHIELDGLDKSRVLELYNAGNKEEELFSYLLITQCNALNQILPGIFQKINDYTELLLPDGLLREGSVLDLMIKDIPEEDWKDQVQIIGWLYQYYISEQKDEVFSRPKSQKIQKEDIPAATQLFTPDWIVRYMVENSLGRLWIEGHPNEDLKGNWKYYLEEADQEKEVEEKLNQIRKEYADLRPEEIKCIDPCIGSGHIGVYLFDVLVQIYESQGYKARDAVRLILENNIYGLDIDERARQLAYFSLMMKAREYDRRFLARENIPQPKVFVVEESNYFKTETGKHALDYFIGGDKKIKEAIESIVSDMEDAKEYGSIVIVKPVDFKSLYQKFDVIREEEFISIDGLVLLDKLLPLVELAEVLSSKYDVVVTNPPYMGSSGFNNELSKYVNKNFKDSKSDLFAVFIEKWSGMLNPYAFNSMVTMQSWMFLSSFEKMRKTLLNKMTISTLMHMENMVMGIAFGTAATVFRNIAMDKYNGTYNHIKFKDIEKNEPYQFPVKDNRFAQISIDKFKKLPGFLISYWATDQILSCFNLKKLSSIITTREGMATADNNRFLRYWQEVDYCKISFETKGDSNYYNEKWFPYNKGGSFRKWYGNNEYIVNWEHDGYEIKNNKDLKTGRIRSHNYNGEYSFRKGITWSSLSSGDISVRFVEEGYLFDSKGAKAFAGNNKDLYLSQTLINSIVSKKFLRIISSTMDFKVGDVLQIPFNSDKITTMENEIIKLAKQNINLSKLDWDMHETSWDFKGSPLLANKTDGLIESAYEAYKNQVNHRFAKLKENEEELNRIFIEIYGLEDELTPQVADKDITVAKIFDSKKEIYDEIKGNRYIMTREEVVKNFLSYFIGCLIGRYSLDEEGLAFAGGDFDIGKYISFKADEDGILPFTDNHYFEDDILESFIKFLKVTFGEENLNENLDFIASELKGKQTDSPREKIRNYFLNDFYKDHCKMYQKLPIYWQYDSGRNNACKGLFYLHRYDKDTFARIRINYVFEIQDRYKQELTRLEEKIVGASGSQRVSLQKEADLLKKKIQESRDFEEEVQHLADSYIEIDLDDGVKENYKIFKDVLSKIK